MNKGYAFILKAIYPYWMTVAGSLIALLCAAGAVIAIGLGLRQLIDFGFIAGNPDLLDKSLLHLLAIVFVLSVASMARSYLSLRLGNQVAVDIKQLLFKHLLHLDASFYEQKSSGEILARINTDTNTIKILLGGSLTTGLRSLMQFLGAITMVFVVSPKLASLACLIIPIALIPIFLYGKKLKGKSSVSEDIENIQSNFFEETLNAIPTVQSFTREDASYNFIGLLSRKLLLSQDNHNLHRSILSACVIFIIFSAISIILWSGGRDVLAAKISQGELISFIFYAALTAGSINSISDVLTDWQLAIKAVNNIQQLLDTKAILNPNGYIFEKPILGKLEINNLSFAYQSNPEKLVINDISLHIKRGDKVALVGSSGAGKSTILKLLMRFYDPRSGSILLDDLDITQMDVKQLRSNIAWVAQEPVVFSGTIMENIRLGNAWASDEDVENAAISAYADEFINKLPDKYYAQIGPRGIKLSGGQKQRLAIARAILKDAPILLLDEATNSLDSLSENFVQKSLEVLMKNRTTIVVAHRLSTILKADKIVVLDNGKISDIGTHTGLMRSSEIYRRFAALQFDSQEDKLRIA